MQLPIRWSAPEVLSRQKYSVESDRYAFGVTLYEIFSRGGKPYPFASNEQVGKEIRAGEAKLEHPPKTPAELYQLILRLTAYESKDRPQWNEVLSELAQFAPQPKSEAPQMPSEKPVVESYNNVSVLGSSDTTIDYHNLKKS